MWYNLIAGVAPFAALGWTLGTLIGHWELHENRALTPKEKIWSWFWYKKETLMWIWIGAIALKMILG